MHRSPCFSRSSPTYVPTCHGSADFVLPRGGEGVRGHFVNWLPLTPTLAAAGAGVANAAAVVGVGVAAATAPLCGGSGCALAARPGLYPASFTQGKFPSHNPTSFPHSRVPPPQPGGRGRAPLPLPAGCEAPRQLPCPCNGLPDNTHKLKGECVAIIRVP